MIETTSSSLIPNIYPINTNGILSQSVYDEILIDFDGCRLCWAIDKQGQREPVNQILYETDDYCLIPALGSIIPGYVLLVSKEHMNSCATLSEDVINSLESQLNQILKLLKIKFPNRNWIVFEQGSTVCSETKGCCIDHLHLHIVPVGNTIISDSVSKLASTPKRLSSISDLPILLSNQNSHYLYFRDTNDNNTVLTVEYPSQFVRKVKL
ncbi:MAG: hypothetical protein OMM_00348 [Candidatus Magnetoglobus multicellularis str. Araruama]|uniref:HIT domain-containing protein n=1 Tax=Candidatus Magnetoglobus multicellularis str. Araruama TaxID=890399 RepID=A0A1V1PHH4_9BACT|nr:MAG: hypothetical protein OMM_00348 [Candidatus Magnetoglobus multicellularis str. Araruama]